MIVRNVDEVSDWNGGMELGGSPGVVTGRGMDR
jgi:hypothetical protein